MITRELVITIPGLPAPQGNLICIGAQGGAQHRLVPKLGKTERAWRKALVSTVKAGLLGEHADPHQPIDVEATLTLPRPKAHYGTGRNAHRLKASAPPHPTGDTSKDVDKLARAILDALAEGGLLANDAQVVELLARKAYVDTPPGDRLPDTLDYPGARIRILPHGAEPDTYADTLI